MSTISQTEIYWLASKIAKAYLENHDIDAASYAEILQSAFETLDACAKRKVDTGSAINHDLNLLYTTLPSTRIH